MADALGLMKGMRHMIGESGLGKNPLTIGEGNFGKRQKQKSNQQFPIHECFLKSYGNGQNSEPICYIGDIGHRGMRTSNAVNFLPATSLSICH